MVIRAEVTTNSSDDEYGRVKVYSEGVYDDTPLIESVGCIPLHKGDHVYLDVSEDHSNPLILGRASSKSQKWETGTNGSVLWESSDGTSWSVCYVKLDKIVIETSNRVKITVDGTNVDFDIPSLKITGGSMEMRGTCAPTGQGAFNCIPTCPFTGVTHIGHIVQGT